MIWWIIFGIIGFAFIFNLWSAKYINKYDCELYFAPPGTGKSVMLRKMADKMAKEGWRVYSTDKNLCDRYIPHDRLCHMKFDNKYDNCLLIDEASVIFNSRNFKDFKGGMIAWWKKHRHMKLKIIMASQSYNDVDKIIRNLTDRYYLLDRFFGVFVVAKRIRKDIALTEAVGEQGGTIADQYKFEPLLSRKSRIVAFLPYWVNKFNSYDTDGFEDLPYVDDELGFD